jgi:hypothetical protein
VAAAEGSVGEQGGRRRRRRRTPVVVVVVGGVGDGRGGTGGGWFGPQILREQGRWLGLGKEAAVAAWWGAA